MMIESMILSITRECNLRCGFCINNDGCKLENEISAEDIIKAINDKMPDLFYVKITGGEPLCNGCIDKTYQVAKQLTEMNCIVQINTNGTNEWKYDDLNKDLLRFQISIDGDEQHHNKLRGDGVYSKAVDFVKNVSSMGYEARIFKVINEDTIEQSESVINLSKKLKVDISFRTMHSIGRAVDININSNRYNLINTLSLMGYQVKSEIKKCSRSLAGGGVVITVDPVGNIIPCPMFPNLSVGNILDDDFDEYKIRTKLEEALGNKTCSHPDGYEIVY